MNNKSFTSILTKVKPADIEAESFRLIEQETPLEIRNSFSNEEWIIVRRIIHTTGDITIAKNIVFNKGAVSSGIEALKDGNYIFCDSNMIKNGLSEVKLKRMNNTYSRSSINCFIADDSVASQAKLNGTTRAVAAVEKAGDNLNGAIILIGNAPSALIRILEKYHNREILPKLIVGMPVGFVNVVESKKLLYGTDIPYISVEGRRGGSPLAVATVHALIEVSKINSL